ncbi:MAG: restriction endonuclease subunit S [Desulfobacula sp.]|nr:restriction endonuclease subunit S [Desulfobacula sp.]
MSYTTGPIKDFVFGVYDGPHATPKDSNHGHIFLGIKNITPDGRLDFYNIKYISDEEFSRWTKRVTPQKDDVVFSYEATLHRYAVIPPEFDGCLGRRMGLIRPNTKKLLSKYLYYYFLSPQWRAYAETKVIVGATVNRLPIKDFPDFKISIPALDKQKIIIDILSVYDDLIENNRRRIQLLEESAQLLYKEWFVHLRFPGHNHLVMIDNFPKKWTKQKLFNIADITMGQSPKSEFYNENNNGLPFHQGVKNYGFRFVENSTYCTKPTRLAAAGDILCSVRAPVGRINITLEKIILGRGLSSIRSKDGFQSYLFYCLKNYFFKEDLIGNGAIYASVTQKDMKNIELCYPHKTLIKCFEKISKPIDEQIANLTFQNRRLSQARDQLLPRLMKGEIKI